MGSSALPTLRTWLISKTCARSEIQSRSLRTFLRAQGKEGPYPARTAGGLFIIPCLGLEPVCGSTTLVCDAWPARGQIYGYLPSCSAVHRCFVTGKARIPRRRHRHPREDFRGDVGVSGESERILARKSVSVSASWNAGITRHMCMNNLPKIEPVQRPNYYTMRPRHCWPVYESWHGLAVFELSGRTCPTFRQYLAGHIGLQKDIAKPRKVKRKQKTSGSSVSNLYRTETPICGATG